MKWVVKSAKWIVGLVILSVLAFSAWHIFYEANDGKRVRVGDGVFMAELASTEAEREKGLSGVSELAPNQAMLFDFGREGLWGIWMKDMMVDIDILWISSGYRVVHIVKNVSPETYPQIFKPDKPARYVLEIPAGTVDSKNINVGNSAYFDLK